jgi:23S rRNA (adenine2503-C2)-methyltransferase
LALSLPPLNGMAKKDIRKIKTSELKSWLEEQGEKAFRATQIEDWLWKKGITHWDEMANLSKELRRKLDENFEIRKLTIATSQKSEDGTVKAAFRLYDSNIVEGVLIPSGERMTACISSQVGCSLTCKFCATGYMDRKRNLDPAEIYDQARAIARIAETEFEHPLTNIVMMGMGEPLLNYANVMEGINRIISPEGMGWSPKRITLSTAGIAKMIKKLADDEVRFNLALSLHAADDEKRNQIMPINETNTLSALKEALRYFYQKTKNQITFEYIAFHGINESQEDAAKLAKFTLSIGAPIKINIIEYNPIAEADFVNAQADRLDAFKAYLESKRLIVNIRRSRGKDIDAACGQLANKQKPAEA